MVTSASPLRSNLPGVDLLPRSLGTTNQQHRSDSQYQRSAMIVLSWLAPPRSVFHAHTWLLLADPHQWAHPNSGRTGGRSRRCLLLRTTGGCIRGICLGHRRVQAMCCTSSHSPPRSPHPIRTRTTCLPSTFYRRSLGSCSGPIPGMLQLTIRKLHLLQRG